MRIHNTLEGIRDQYQARYERCYERHTPENDHAMVRAMRYYAKAAEAVERLINFGAQS